MRRVGMPKASISSLAENSPSSCAGNSRNTAVPQRANATPEEALNKLTPRQADIIRRHYFGGKSFAEIAQEDGTSTVAPRNHEVSAFIALRQNPALARWHDDIISTKAWTGTGWNAWNRYGSVQERTVEYWDEQVKKYEEHVRELVEKYGISAII